jgi:hypothetical protein
MPPDQSRVCEVPLEEPLVQAVQQVAGDDAPAVPFQQLVDELVWVHR